MVGVSRAVAAPEDAAVAHSVHAAEDVEVVVQPAKVAPARPARVVAGHLGDLAPRLEGALLEGGGDRLDVVQAAARRLDDRETTDAALSLGPTALLQVT